MVEVFIVGLLSLGSLPERSAPFLPLVHPSGETATREPCEAALGLMAEQGEWSGPPLNARRGGFWGGAAVTPPKGEMKNAPAAPRLPQGHPRARPGRGSRPGLGPGTAGP